MLATDLVHNFFILFGAFALIYMALTALHGLRDEARMSRLSGNVKKSMKNHDFLSVSKIGVAAMISEGDTMRSSSAIFGFSNGKIMSQYDCIRALISASFSKSLWVWACGLVMLVSLAFEYAWAYMATIGFILILCHVRMSGKLLFYVGFLLLSLILARETMTYISKSAGSLMYISQPSGVGIILSAFAGVFVGALLSGNLLCFFIPMLFILSQECVVESCVAFAVGTEAGTLFPMSIMISGAGLTSRKAFICYCIVISFTLVIDILLLSLLPSSFLSRLGVLGFLIEYTFFYSIMIPVIYQIIGGPAWSKMGNKALVERDSTKRHLYKTDIIYRPHVAMMLVHAENEIVNLQYRIHKMLDFTIELIDVEEQEPILEHIRKYRAIVNRTCDEIADYILMQTSAKTNEHISDLVKERLSAIALQHRLGDCISDMAEAIFKTPKSQYPMVRRCVVALETLINQSEKIVSNYFKINPADLAETDVDAVSNLITELLEEYGVDRQTSVLPYEIDNSRFLIKEIINKLK